MDAKELREILKLLKSYQVREFEMDEDGRRLRIVRPPDGSSSDASTDTLMAATPMVVHAPAMAVQGTPMAAAPPAPVPVAPAPEPAAAGSEEDVDDGSFIVTAPMVGTYYRAPSPDAAPYVEVGDRVKPGDILCIIEAMKLMNEIEAERAGTVVEILVQNATPVEFGANLFRLSPDGS
jgi:acetyl-CoA carboxylase biotin carboxyl carrier protein